MNCAEFERLLPDMLESVPTVEQQAHLRSCGACADLVSDLELISRQARFLSESEEPSPRVWNSIEIALRQEGLIHEPRRTAAGLKRTLRWGPAWLLPIAAGFLFAFGVIRYHQMPGAGQSPPRVTSASVAAPLATVSVSGHPILNLPKEDIQLLDVVARHSPTLRSVYAADLENVDSYIRDAEQSAHNHPNDEEAQQYLMNAYEQKNMVYEMALDRSLP